MKLGVLEKKIKALPDGYKLKLEGYIDALLADAKMQRAILASDNANNSRSQEPSPVFGSGKGLFGAMSDDFDEPLDDMKEYMH